jgi:pimeloyl-ACP methyl ester carboxylesterase
MPIFNSLSSLQTFELLTLTVTTIYHQLASYHDRQYRSPPGKLVITPDGINRHLAVRGTGKITVIIDSSLGGVEGYLLITELSKLTRVCIYDRCGYGWSQMSSKPRTSQQIVTELATLLDRSEITPPYILIGDSFGSYNMRLFAHQFPERTVGLILTDGLHERAMLSLPLSLQLLKVFFTLSFGFVAVGASLGIVRLCGMVGGFELIKPELNKFDRIDLQHVKRSFYSASHWLTMMREMWGLDTSARQLQTADDLGNLPLISLKSQTFLRPLFGLKFLSLPAADRSRDLIHQDLLKLSTNSQQVAAERSSHFIWIDRPELIVNSVATLLLQLEDNF